MKLKEILDLEKSVNNLANILLPTPEENRRVYQLLKTIAPEIENYSIQLGKILVRYGDDDGDGKYSIPRTSPNYNIAIKEISQMQNLEIEISFVPLEKQFNELNLSAVDVYTLEKAGVLILKEGD